MECRKAECGNRNLNLFLLAMVITCRSLSLGPLSSVRLDFPFNLQFFLFKVVELHQEDLNLGALQCIHIGCDEVWCLGQGVETR